MNQKKNFSCRQIFNGLNSDSRGQPFLQKAWGKSQPAAERNFQFRQIFNGLNSDSRGQAFEGYNLIIGAIMAQPFLQKAWGKSQPAAERNFQFRQIFNGLNSDSRGQAFEGYNLIIGAIMALFMLVIIIGGITYVEEIRYRTSNDRLMAAFDNAVKSPNRTEIEASNLVFKSGTMFTASGFAKKFSLDPSCVFFDDSDASDIKVNDSTIEITSSMLLKASVYCEVNSECEESDKKISCNLLISPQ